MSRHHQRVQRFESLLEPFHSSTSSSPSSSSSPRDWGPSLPAVGERVPGLGSNASQSAEQWRGDELRRLCFEGIPDEPKHLRPTAYSFLLALPHTHVLVEQYSAFLSEISDRISALPSPDLTASDVKEDRLLREIEQDVDRTFGALAWFSAEVDLVEGEDVLWKRLDLLKEAEKRRAGEPIADQGTGKDSTLDARTSKPPHTRRRALLRPLFAYAFFNPGVSFVQGMSFPAAVLAFVYSAAPKSSPLEVEAATFFAFGALVSQLRDLYVPTLDAPEAGVGGPSAQAVGLGATVARFQSLLLFLDPMVADALDRKGVDPSPFIMRWLTTIFATEFSLPDVVRVWDRILSLYPAEGAAPPVETMSPVLSHLLDLALAVFELHRQTIISPFAKMPKIMSILQNLTLEGERIDDLLRTAGDIRERRLGRGKRASVSTLASPNRSNTGIGRRIWSTASPAHPSVAEAADFELDDRSSAAGSDVSRPSRSGQRFGSLAFSSPRSSATADLADNVTVVEGKVLPPPPARVDEAPNTIASLIEEELRADIDYGVDEGDNEVDAAASLRDRAASGWGGLKSSLSRFAASDTAAALQKRATNLQLAAAQSASTASTRLASSDAAAALFKAQSNATVKAQLLVQQLAHETPERLAQLRDAGGRLVASTGAERGGPRRPGSPREAPFTPPGSTRDRDVSPLSSPRLGASSSASADMVRGGSNGPRPLLLSSAARRARSESEDGSGAGFARSRSPSQSPVLARTGGTSLLLSPDLTIPPLSRSPSTHGRSPSHLDSPTRPAAGAFRPRSPSLQQPASIVQDDDTPIVSRRVQDGAAGLRRGGPSVRTVSGVGSPVPMAVQSAQDGRSGWSLTDAPMRGDRPTAHGTPGHLPPLELGSDMTSLSGSLKGIGVSDDGPETAERIGSALWRGSPSDLYPEEPFLPPREEPFAHPTEAPFVPPGPPVHGEPTAASADSNGPAPTPSGRPLRGSSLALATSQTSQQSVSSPVSHSPRALTAPPRKSSLAPSLDSVVSPDVKVPDQGVEDDHSPEEVEVLPPAQPKLSRRPAAQRRRTSRMSQVSLDLSGPEARRVASEFLTRSTSGSATGPRPKPSSRTSEASRAGVPGSRSSVATFDEGALYDSYGAGHEGEPEREP